MSGVGSFSRLALEKRLAGRKAQAGSFIGSTSEGIGAQASRRDIETMFQLVWLRFTQPRVDTAAFRAFANQAKAAMSNQRNQPGSVFNDTITLTMGQHHPRARIFSPEALDSVDLGRALQIYRERFANAGDFTFFLVGSFPID